MGVRGGRTELSAAGSRARSAAARVGAGGAVLALAVPFAGCSVKGGENANLINGKIAFVAKCGSCHTLERAGTKGIVGPNLDESFRASVNEGLGRGSIRGVVEGQIKNPNAAISQPQGVMPKNLVSGQTARDVAAYVAASAARPGKDSGLLASAVEAPGSGKPAEESGGKLAIAASPSGQLAYTATKATAKAGTVRLEMPNMSGVSHNLAIEAGSGGASGPGPVLAATGYTAKGTVSVSVTLKPGTYTYFCQVPGHRPAGMFGTITVK